MQTFEYRDQPPADTIIEVVYKQYEDGELQDIYRSLWLRSVDLYVDGDWSSTDHRETFDWITMEHRGYIKASDEEQVFPILKEGKRTGERVVRSVQEVTIIRWGNDETCTDEDWANDPGIVMGDGTSMTPEEAANYIDDQIESAIEDPYRSYGVQYDNGTVKLFGDRKWAERHLANGVIPGRYVVDPVNDTSYQLPDTVPVKIVWQYISNWFDDQE